VRIEEGAEEERDEVTGEFRKLRNEELPDLYSKRISVTHIFCNCVDSCLLQT
jgi:hypothetical protein